jgi:hypothetical protein
MRYSVPFQYDPSVVQLITRRCTEVEGGGRMIDAVLTNTLLPEVSRELLLRWSSSPLQWRAWPGSAHSRRVPRTTSSCELTSFGARATS